MKLAHCYLALASLIAAVLAAIVVISGPPKYIADACRVATDPIDIEACASLGR